MSNWCRRLLFMALALLMPVGLMMPTADAHYAQSAQEDQAPTPDPTTSAEKPGEAENSNSSTPEAEPESDTTPRADEPGSASPEVEETDPEESTPQPQQEATPAPSATLDEEEIVEPSTESFEGRNLALSAVGDAVDCSYADGNTGGQYKDTLCWFDFSYLSEDGTSQPLTTEWRQVGEITTETIDRNTFNDDNYCSRTEGLPAPFLEYRRSTVTFESVMGAEYGAVTFRVAAELSSRVMPTHGASER